YTGRGWRRQDTVVLKPWSANSTVQMGGKAATDDMNIAVFREASDHAFIFLPDGVKTIKRLPYRGLQDGHGDAYFNDSPSRRIRLLMTLDHSRNTFVTLAPPNLHESETRNIPSAVVAWVKTVLGNNHAPNQASMLALREALLQWDYDLNVRLDDDHPIASFIQNRRGHCELFATTLALAARSIGLAARVVNGYYGGEWNETGQFIIMRQQEAHSWTEVWLDGRWQAMDATPPSRWNLSAVRFPAFDDVWESIRLQWYRYVLEFENDDRRAFFNQLIQWFRASLPRLIFWATLLFSVWWAWQLWLQRRSVQRFQWQLRMVDRWLRYHGINRQPWQVIRHLKKPNALDDELWQQWLQDWESQCYHPQHTPWTARKLRGRLKELDAAIKSVHINQ
ncbi:MAG: transglutaminase-like domain-containing protein, partial [Mariprofundaceae bacterium]|nr:transglutaminase-like domain-containing protein [Mariprofundaceae bacterium]